MLYLYTAVTTNVPNMKTSPDSNISRVNRTFNKIQFIFKFNIFDAILKK